MKRAAPRIVRTLVAVAFAAGTIVQEHAAHADGSLRRFQEPHRPPPTSSSSSSSSDSSEDSDGSTHKKKSTGASIVGGVFSALFSGGSGSHQTATDDEPPVVDDRAEIEALVLRRRLATTIYSDDGGSAYVSPYRRDEGADGSVTARRVAFQRNGELRGGGFFAVNEEVVHHDANLNGFVGLFMLGAGWERFSAQSGCRRPSTPSTCFVRASGPTCSAQRCRRSSSTHSRVAHSCTGSARPSRSSTWRSKRALIPSRPLAFYAGATTSLGAHGPPILDGRLEGGVSLGRVDLRAGFRALKQQPEQEACSGLWSACR